MSDYKDMHNAEGKGTSERADGAFSMLPLTALILSLVALVVSIGATVYCNEALALFADADGGALEDVVHMLLDSDILPWTMWLLLTSVGALLCVLGISAATVSLLNARLVVDKVYAGIAVAVCVLCIVSYIICCVLII